LANHSQGGNKMDEDFNGSPSQETTETVQQETTQVVGNTNPSTETTATDEPKIKIKYNHEEREISVSEARELAQKGLHMDKAVEKAKVEAHQAARDSYIAEQGYEWMGKPVTTEAQYKQALKEQEVYERLQSQSLPEEVISEILEGRRDREERQQEKLTVKQQQQRDTEYKEFFDYFASENDRSFDPAKDAIPDEVWQMVETKGKSLTDAFQIHELKQTKAKLNEFTKGTKTQESNSNNAMTGTGSVTGNGNSTNDYFTADQVRAMSPEQVKSNLKSIENSMKRWT
jgi:hypothetical protein